MDNNDWSSWRNHVLKEIIRLDGNIKTIAESNSKQLIANLIDITRLKVWSLIYGIVGGAIGSIVLKGLVNKW